LIASLTSFWLVQTANGMTVSHCHIHVAAYQLYSCTQFEYHMASKSIIRL